MQGRALKYQLQISISRVFQHHWRPPCSNQTRYETFEWIFLHKKHAYSLKLSWVEAIKQI